MELMGHQAVTAKRPMSKIDSETILKNNRKPKAFGQLEAGFTLLELLVVLAIVGMFATLVPGIYSKYADSAKFKSFAVGIVTDLRQARAIARVDMESGYLWIDLREGAYGVANFEAKKLPQEYSLSVISGFNRVDKKTRHEFVFFPGGGSTGGEIVVASKEGRRKKIVVDWLTGRIDETNQ